MTAMPSQIIHEWKPSWTRGSDEGDSPSSSLKERRIEENHKVRLESVNGYRVMTFTLSTTILTILFFLVKRKYENNLYFPQLSGFHKRLASLLLIVRAKATFQHNISKRVKGD